MTDKETNDDLALAIRSFVAGGMLLAFSPLAHAGATTDGTVGSVQSLSGNFTIPQSLGMINGGNLLHSFQNFSINAGESATFTTTSNLSNVISRVTGGTASNINGQLKLSAAAGSSPNFFFINPAGVTFGAGASVDVPAGFHVSTANYLRFADGSVLYANPSLASTLSSAEPEAFGFFGTSSASVVINNGATIAAKASQPIGIVAGDIEINNAVVSTQGGDIRMVANGLALQEVPVTGTMMSTLPYAYGYLDLLNGGRINASSSGSLDGGTVLASAGNISIDPQSSGKFTGLFSDAVAGSTGNAGNIKVKAYYDLSLNDGAQISSSTLSSGNAGIVYVDAGTVNIDGKGQVTGIFSSAKSGSTGYAGGIELYSAGKLSITDGGQISSSTYSTGDAGYVAIDSGSIAINGKGNVTGIFSVAIGDGNAGYVDVNSAGSLSIIDGGQISSSTYSAGNASYVTVEAKSILIDAQTSTTGTGIFSSSSSDGIGNAGTIKVTAKDGTLLIKNGGQISSNTYGVGYAGSVDVDVSGGSIGISTTGSITSSTFGDGNAGYVAVKAANIAIDGDGNTTDLTGIASRAEQNSGGNAGTVDVTATGTIAIVGGGSISSETFAAGNAGSVTVKAADISLSGTDSGIYSKANKGSLGYANSVYIETTGALSLANGGQVSSSTEGDGSGGIVTIKAGSISIDGQGKSTGIFSDTSGPGAAWYLDVTAAGNLSILNGGRISSSSTSSGASGYVYIKADSLDIDGKGTTTGIFSNVGGGGDAGYIDVTTSGNISIANRGVISSSTTADGDSGTIVIKANDILIDGQGKKTGILSDTSGAGNARYIDIVASGIVSILEGGQISSSATASGNSGYVYVDAGSVGIDGKGMLSGIFSNTSSMGSAGYVQLTTKGALSIVNRGAITSSTTSSGAGGYINIDAGSISIDGGDWLTGIFSETRGSGHAGGNVGAYGDVGIRVKTAGSLSITNGGQLSSNAYSSGNAGKILVDAGSITINRQGSGQETGILSDANSGSSGSSGAIDITTANGLVINNGGFISSSTFGAGPAGAVRIDAKAGGISIDGQGVYTGILSDAYAASTGNAGSVDLVSTGNVSIANGGQVSSSTFSSGRGGSVNISARNLDIDGKGNAGTGTGVFSNAEPGSSGNAGNVTVTASEKLTLTNRGAISSTTFSDGYAGTVTVTAGDIAINGKGALTGIFSNAVGPGVGSGGDISVQASGSLSVYDGGEISSNTYSWGNAGTIYVTAGNIELDAKSTGNSTGIFTIAQSGSAGKAGYITISTPGSLSIKNGAKISSATESTGWSGIIGVDAGSISIDGGGILTGIFNGTEGEGHARYIDIVATGNVSISDGGRISSSTTSSGDAGQIYLSAGSLTVDGKNTTSVTGIFSETRGSGNVGGSLNSFDAAVNITSSGAVAIVNGGQVSSTTYAEGSAGVVAIEADSIRIDKGNSSRTTGIFSSSVGSIGEPDGSSSAGDVKLSFVKDLSILNGGLVSTSTSTPGDAGRIRALSESGNLTIDGKGRTTGIFSNINPTGSGNPSYSPYIVVNTKKGNISLVDGGFISSSTFGDHSAGDVYVTAGNLTIDGRGAGAAIVTDATKNSWGNSGFIQIDVADKLSIANNGQIASNSFSPAGQAYWITVNAGTIVLENGAKIISAAMDGSYGIPGWLEIKAAKSITLSGDSRFSIQNDVTVPLDSKGQPEPRESRYVSVEAPSISLINSHITAESTGNLPASAITINYTDRMVVDPSYITTSAVTGSGAPITITGSGPLVVDHSQITTSVSGTGLTSANGGDITIKAPLLVMNTGFIQANTAATAASGGNVTIDVPTLISSGNSLYRGGEPLKFESGRAGYNVIQAAAPDGVSGAVQISSPEIDLSGSLNTLVAQVLDFGNLSADLCRVSEGSSLTPLGRGGLPATSTGWLRP